MYPITFTVFSFLCADYNLYETDSVWPLVLNVSYASLYVLDIYKQLQHKAILFAFTCEVGTNNLLCILVPCLHTIAISWLIQSQLRCFSLWFQVISFSDCGKGVVMRVDRTWHWPAILDNMYSATIQFVLLLTVIPHTLPSFFEWMDF